MKPSELVLGNNETEALEIINAFLDKQHILASKFREALGGNVDIFSLKRHAPRMIDALNDTWAVAVHGVGVRFINKKTEEVVDVHVGLFDSPDAFDAWRLEQYAESIHSEIEDFETTIERLASLGAIRRHNSLANHYELPLSQDMR